MKNINFKLSCLLMGLLIASCYYDVEEDLYPPRECDTENVSFSEDVYPIIDNSCLLCHNAGSNLGNITLEGYSNVVEVIERGRLLGAIRHESGFSPMPKGNPKLLDCQIQKIEQWVNNGYPNN